MKIGAIILSRLTSKRLPAKALLDFGKAKVVDFIHERIAASGIESTVVATSLDESDDPLVRYCQAQGRNVYRGSLDNVAERFLACAESLGLDYAVRINGDNLFTDPKLLANMVADARLDRYDFISNVPGRTYPYGMSIEVIRVDFYRELIKKFSDPGHFEHVTSYLYENEGMGERKYVKAPHMNFHGIHLSLDTPQDFDKMNYLRDHFEGDISQINLDQIVDLLREYVHAVAK